MNVFWIPAQNFNKCAYDAFEFTVAVKFFGLMHTITLKNINFYKFKRLFGIYTK